MPKTTPVEVELWIRALHCGDCEEHDTLVARLEALERRGVVGDVHVRTWPHEIALDGELTPHERTIITRIRAFREWAARNDVRLPAFAEQTTLGVGRMGPEQTAMMLPQTALAVYRDGVLEWVAPCVEAGRERTVAEWIAAAENGQRAQSAIQVVS